MQNSQPHTHILQSVTSLMSLTSSATEGSPQGQQKNTLQKKIFGLSIFLFAQNLWHAVMKNANIHYAHRR